MYVVTCYIKVHAVLLLARLLHVTPNNCYNTQVSTKSQSVGLINKPKTHNVLYTNPITYMYIGILLISVLQLLLHPFHPMLMVNTPLRSSQHVSIAFV